MGTSKPAGNAYSVLDNLFEGCQIIGYDWRYLYINAAGARHGHKSAGELVGRTMMESYPDIENTELFGHLKRCMEERTPYLLENLFNFPDGSQGWFELSIEPVPEGVFVLSLDITQRKQNEERIRYLNSTLKTLRNLNQLITQEKSREKLLKKSCEMIVETRGFYFSWILLFDGNKSFYSAGIPGYEQTHSAFRAQIESGQYPACVEKIINHTVPFEVCDQLPGGNTKCINQTGCREGKGIISRLEYKRKVYGVIAAYLPAEIANDPEEQSLFEELAGDLAFALYSIEIEQEQQRLNEEIKRSEYLYRSLFENMLNGLAYCKMLFVENKPVDFIFLMVNDAFEAQTGLKDVVGKNVSEVIPGILKSDPELFEIYGRVALTGKPERFESYVTALDAWFNVSVYSPKQEYFVAVFDVVTRRKKAEIENRTSRRFLEITSRNYFINLLLGESVKEIRELTGCEAAGIRLLDESGNIPYQAYLGFSREFYEKESPLSIKSDQCMCINVIKGTTDPNLPFYTPAGSFFMNGTSRFLESVSDEDKGKTRNVCNQHGYETVVLSPVRSGKQIIGLIHVADHRKNMMPLRMVELVERVASVIGPGILRAMAEEELIRSEEKCKAIFDAATDGILLADPASRMFYEGNEAICRMLGYNREEIKSLGVNDIHPKAELARVISDFEARARSEINLSLDIPVLRKDGSVFYADINSAPVTFGGKTYLLGLFRDATQRRKSEEELHMLSRVVQQSPSIVIVSDTTGKIEYVNPRFLQITGYGEQEIIGTNVSKLAGPSAEDQSAMWQTLLEGNEWHGEFLNTKKDGATYWESASISPLRDHDGAATHFIKVAEDITRQKLADEEKHQLRNKAEVSSRLATIGEMAAGIAHEINNPLTSVIGFSELLMQEDLPPGIKEQLKYVLDGSNRVKDIVKRLLTFARQSQPVRSSFDIHALIDNTIELRSYVLRTSNIEVIKKYDPSIPWITADPGQIQQVMVNLIVNAEYAMKKAHNRGTLTVTTHNYGDNIAVIFHDDGPGMDKKTLSNLFHPFFTTKDPGEGTGLGLSLSRSILVDHGGTIEAESEIGKGSTFIIRLPLVPSVETFQNEDSKINNDVPKPNISGTVLVVDDEPSIRAYLEKTLSLEGHTVRQASDLSQVLDEMKNFKFDVILLDIRMPGSSGKEVFERIATKWPEMTKRVIFVTGDTSDATIRDFPKGKDIHYISKPIDKAQLLGKIRDVMGKNKG